MCLPARVPSALNRMGPLFWLLGPLLRTGSRAHRPEGSFQDEQAEATLTVAPPWLVISVSLLTNGQKGTHLAGLGGRLKGAACGKCLLRC